MTQAFESVLEMAQYEKGVHARCRLYGGNRPCGKSHAATRLDLDQHYWIASLLP